jgi:hypothetical protein
LALAVVAACGSDEEQDASAANGAGAAGNGSSTGNAGGDGGAAGGDGPGTPSSSSSGLPPDPECEGPLGEPQDPSTLPACCPDYGGAHCLLDVPDELKAQAAPCDGGGYCVPDEFIATGGVFTPATCTSIQAAPGVCLSACIPQVAEYVDLLPQDVCKTSERCVPCVSPLDGMSTGACDLGFECPQGSGGAGGGQGGSGGAPPPCDDPATCVWDCPMPALDPSSLPSCPSGCAGHCVANALVPPEQASQLGSCDASTLCVPDELITTAGKFIADTCASVAGFEGRCLSTCIPEVAGQAAELPQSTCTGGEVCVPCYDPFDGTDTGACTLSCDPGPQDPPQTFPECCQGWGTCVPTQSVPADQVDKFAQESCAATLTCVPETFLDGSYQPVFCEPSFLIWLLTGQDVGACLPQCMPDVASAPLVDQDVCPDYHLCIPCFDQGGQSTGACEAI